MAGCSACRAARSDLKQALRQGDLAGAAKAAAKGVKIVAAKLQKPRVVPQPRRR